MNLTAGQTVTLAADNSRPEQVHVFDEPTVLAVQAAYAARRPLLVRGEPGVGKTQVAAAVAQAAGRVLLPYVVDSRTESRALLWELDAVLRLAEAQLLGGLHYSRDEARDVLAVEKFLRPGPIWWAFDWESAAAQARLSNSPTPPIAPGCDPRHGCVLLIDEIDKAESDVPNGLLEALGAGQFTPFGREEPVVARGVRPLVIITTNEERVLPDAFIRRCLVLPIELPRDDAGLSDLLVRRGQAHFARELNPQGDAWPDDALELLHKAAQLLVSDRNAAKAASVTPLPGQAEYLDLVRAALELASDQPARLQLIDQIARFAFRKQSGSP